MRELFRVDNIFLKTYEMAVSANDLKKIKLVDHVLYAFKCDAVTSLSVGMLIDAVAIVNDDDDVGSFDALKPWARFGK